MQKENLKQKVEILFTLTKEKFGVSREDFLKKSRKEPIPIARKYIGYVLRKEKVKLKIIQKEVNCTHGNLCSGVKSLKGQAEVDKKVKKDLDDFYFTYKFRTSLLNTDFEIQQLRNKIAECESQINFLLVANENNTV